MGYVQEHNKIISISISEKIQTKLMTRFSKNSKKIIFDQFSKFLGTKFFSKKIRFCLAQLHMCFQPRTRIQRKLMIQFHENAQTDEKVEGRKDRNYFIGPFWLPPGLQLATFKTIIMKTSGLPWQTLSNLYIEWQF